MEGSLHQVSRPHHPEKQNINKALTHPKETTAGKGQMTVGHAVEKSRHRANQTTHSVSPTTSSPSSNARQRDWGAGEASKLTLNRVLKGRFLKPQEE